MDITVRYLSQWLGLQDARLLAGSGGLDRVVRGCDILDYELDRSLNGKYSYSNFSADRLVLTSFQSAKDNPYLIDEAVKHCIAANASGLVIRNVYQLPIHDYTLRYADSKNFPIFLLENRKAFFEDIIVQVDRCVSYAAYAALTEVGLARLISGDCDASERERLTVQLFPVFHQTYELIYIRPDVPLSGVELQRLYGRCAEAVAEDTSCAVLPYRGALFVFRSGGLLTEAETLVPPGCCAGISAAHHYGAEIGHALAEAMDAAAVQIMRGTDGARCVRYADIGIYRALLPLRMNETLHNYTRAVLEPLVIFDAENRAELLATVLELVRCGGDLHRLAEVRGEHENTLRNRLEKVRVLTGLNFRKPSDYEELALASRVLMLEQEKIPAFDAGYDDRKNHAVGEL